MTLEKIFETYRKFPKTIHDKWGIRNEYLTVVFISFIHHLTKNGGEDLNRLRWSTLVQGTKLFAIANKILEHSEICLNTINQLKEEYAGGDQSILSLLESTSQHLDETLRVARSLYRDIPKISSEFSSSQLRTFVQNAQSLSKQIKLPHELATTLENDSNSSKDAKRLAKSVKEGMDRLSDLAKILLRQIDKINKKKHSPLDDILSIKRANDSKSIFILSLFSEFFSFISDERRIANKSECFDLYDILTKDPELTAILNQIYKVGKPKQFSHVDATETEYEKFCHSTTTPNPVNVLEFEARIKKDWYCYKDGQFYLDDDIIMIHDESIVRFLEKCTKSYEEDGFKVNYMFFPTDFRLMFTCKSQERHLPGTEEYGSAEFLSGTGGTTSRKNRHYIYELTFSTSPSSFKRGLQQKKTMANYLWKDDEHYDQSILDTARAMHDEYGICLWQEFIETELRNLMTDFLADSLRADVIMPVIKEYTDNLAYSFMRMSEILAKYDDEETTKQQLMKALGDYPVTAANTCDISSLDGEELKMKLQDKVSDFIDNALAKYAFITAEDTALREKIKNALSTSVEKTLNDIDFKSIGTSILEHLPSCSTDLIRQALNSPWNRTIDDFRHMLQQQFYPTVLLDAVGPSSVIHDLVADRLDFNLCLEEKETSLLYVISLRNDLKNALTANPEKLLERYDFLTSLDDWSDTVTNDILRIILSANIIEKLIMRDEAITKRVFLNNGECRKRIEEAIGMAWKIRKEDNEDLTAVIKTFTSFLTRRNHKELYSIRRDFIDPNSPYIPLPMLIYDTEAPKRWKEYKEDAKSLADTMAEATRPFLRQTKKHCDQRSELNDLLVVKTEQERVSYIWGDGSRYDKEIKETLESIRQKGYKLPNGLDETSIKNSLHDYLCNDTIAFLSTYDFSTELPNWVKQKANIFIESYPVIQCILDNNDNLNLLIEEFKTGLKVIDRKYKIDDDAHIDSEISEGVFKHTKRSEQTLSENDYQQNFNVILANDCMKVLRNFKYECNLKTYLLRVKENQSKKEMRDKFRKENQLKRKPSKKSIKEEAKASEAKRKQELLYLLEILRDKEMKQYFYPNGKADSYEMMLLIFEMKYSEEKEDKEIKKALVEDYNYEDIYVQKNFAQKKRRCKKLFEESQKKIMKIHQKEYQNEELTILERAILEKTSDLF